MGGQAPPSSSKLVFASFPATPPARIEKGAQCVALKGCPHVSCGIPSSSSYCLRRRQQSRLVLTSLEGETLGKPFFSMPFLASVSATYEGLGLGKAVDTGIFLATRSAEALPLGLAEVQSGIGSSATRSAEPAFRQRSARAYRKLCLCSELTR